MTNLEKNRIIAAIRSEKDLVAAFEAPVDTFFLLNANILTLRAMVRESKIAGKKAFVHIDLAEGIGKDQAGVGFLKKIGVDGVISTRANIIRMAKEWELKTVQRFFIVDSHSIDTAIDSAHSVRPDMIEVMPGVIPKIITRFCMNVKIPIIAGGLIETKQEIASALDAGATRISTAKAELWYWNNKGGTKA